MKLKNPFRGLTKFELSLWIVSILVIIGSSFVSGETDILNVTASLIGVTALIFVAKGFVIGQILVVVFSVFYGIISFYFGYYGEMITYLCMTAPMAIMSVISWVKHPFKDSSEVEVSRLNAKKLIIMSILSAVVTVVFYFILRALGTANLIVSTLSVTTSFIAVYFTFLRSPYYAIGYAANDIALIILWILATIEDISYISMTACFVMFLFNDLYGYYNWRKMRKRQEKQLKLSL